ncbi:MULTISPECIES: phage major tail tube protein [unclassified Pseudomonas]|uniref:phage major tail tube protein n=1 Tax=unclassified Pseudomonas TaxID=196821 RepID=UPI000A1F9EF3|nr:MULTISPECIES: phage major tail tube protein [unclassified Pseudomonas]
MIPQVLRNMALFSDGVSFAGDVPTLTLPKLTQKVEDYQGGGMAAPIEFAVGLEKLESSFTTNGVRRESLKLFGLADQTAANLVFRGVYSDLKGRKVPVIATLRGGVKEIDPGDWKAATVAEIKHAVKVTYYKLEIDGRVMYEIDPLNMIQVVDGVDQLAEERTALGL